MFSIILPIQHNTEQLPTYTLQDLAHTDLSHPLQLAITLDEQHPNKPDELTDSERYGSDSPSGPVNGTESASGRIADMTGASDDGDAGTIDGVRLIFDVSSGSFSCVNHYATLGK